MKRIALLGLCGALLCHPALAQFVVTNEVNGTMESASYGTAGFWQPYFATHFYNSHPEYTNHIYDVSGAFGWQGNYEELWEKNCLPFWASFAVPGNDWILVTDNGGMNYNATTNWGTKLFSGPPIFWNGTDATNEGIATVGIKHWPLGNIIQDTTGGDGGGVDRNLACMDLATLVHSTPVDLWHMLSPGWVPDQAGARKLGFYIGSHPFAAGYLCVAIKVLIGIGVETNIGSCTLDFNAAIASATNHQYISGVVREGNTLWWTNRFDGMPMAWDVPDGTITNDARDAFVVMPELGNAFLWTIQVTNLPAGNYNLTCDGELIATLTASQLAAGWNMFTNYAGPLWRQRVAVLAAKRMQEGKDPVTLVQTHTAGEVGGLGFKDLVNYKSAAFGAWNLNYRGAALTNVMADYVSDLRHYDVAIHDTAQQTNHVFALTRIFTKYRMRLGEYDNNDMAAALNATSIYGHQIHEAAMQTTHIFVVTE